MANGKIGQPIEQMCSQPLDSPLLQFKSRTYAIQLRVLLNIRKSRYKKWFRLVHGLGLRCLNPSPKIFQACLNFNRDMESSSNARKPRLTSGGSRDVLTS